MSDVFEKALVKLQAIIAINTAMTNILLAKYLKETLKRRGKNVWAVLGF